MIRTLVLVFLLVCSVSPRLAWAEEVVLTNGDRISGKVQSLKGGKLTVSTEWSSRIEIAFDKVQSISTTETVLLVEFTSGGRMTSQLQVDPEQITLTSVARPMRVDRHEILTIDTSETPLSLIHI